MIRLALLRLLESFFRHRWLFLLPIVVAGAASAYFAYAAKPRYFSSGTLYVQGESLVATLNDLPNEGGSYWVTPSDLMVSQAGELLGTEAFLRSVVKGTPFEDQLNGTPEDVSKAITEINKQLWVSKSGANMVNFGAYSNNPEVSNKLATQLPESYILWKLNTDRQDSIAAQDFFTKLLVPELTAREEARRKLEDFLGSLNDEPGSRRTPLEELQISQFQSAVAQADQRVRDLQNKDESAKLAQQQAEQALRKTYVIIDVPKQATRPNNGLSKRLLDSSIYLIAGVLLSIIGIIGLAVLDPSVRFPIDVRHRLHLPVLAMPPNSDAVFQHSTSAIASKTDDEQSSAAALTPQPFAGQLAQSSQE